MNMYIHTYVASSKHSLPSANIANSIHSWRLLMADVLSQIWRNHERDEIANPKQFLIAAVLSFSNEKKISKTSLFPKVPF